MAKPDSVIDPMSPPLPLTASTRTGLPVNGSFNSNFELVFPPPKFVIRRSAPSRLERYRNSPKGLSSRLRAQRSSHRSLSRSSFCVSGINDLRVVSEPRELPIPFLGLTGLKNLDGEGAIHHGTDFRKRGGHSGRKNLHGDVSQCRGLGGASQYTPAGGVRCERIQQTILGTATDDSNLPDRLAGDSFQIDENLPILEGQAFKHRSDICAGRRWLGLPRLHAKCVDRAWHVDRVKEGLVVRINEVTKLRLA